ICPITRMDGTFWPRSTVESMLTLTPERSARASSPRLRSQTGGAGRRRLPHPRSVLGNQGQPPLQHLALGLRTDEQGEDEDRRRAAGRNQHGHGEAHGLALREDGKDRSGEARPDRALVIAEARRGGAHLGRKALREIGRILPVDRAKKGALEDESAG